MAVDVSHFSMVGYAIETSDAAALTRSAEKVAADCRPQELTKTDIICLVSDPSGGELRLAFRKHGDGAEVETLNPAFVGEGRAKIEIGADVSDPEWRPFEILLSAHFAGDEIPLVIELADPSDAARLPAGAKVTMDIAAFGFEPKIFADEAAYYEDQRKSGTKVTFASNFFIPTGMFGDKGARPAPYAEFAGKVIKAELRTNAAGGKKFWWTLVQTYGGATFDVVMDPQTVTREPVAGSIVSGNFWLSARLVTAP